MQTTTDDESKTDANSIGILSSNLNLMPPGLLSGLTTGNTIVRAVGLAKKILEQHQDDREIVVVQELYHDQARNMFIQLMTKAGYRCYEGAKANCVAGYKYHSGQAVFIKTNVINVLDNKLLCFAEYGVNSTGPLETCVPKCAIKIKLSKTGVPIDLVALHLQSEIMVCGWDIVNSFTGRRTLSDAFNSIKYNRAAEVRKQQLELLINRVSLGNRTVFVGDYNVCYTSPEFQQVKQILDAKPLVNQEYTTIGAKGNNSRYKISWKIGTAIWGGGQVDHVLVRSGISKTGRTFKTLIMKNKEDISLSDHEAIISRLTLL